MGPAEIVASLTELCAEVGPRVQTGQIADWIEDHNGFGPDDELIEFAKRMKARNYARQLLYDDDETGRRIKRLWSFRDRETGERYYHDIAQLPADRRRQLIKNYLRFNEQLRTVRQAMADYFAGQNFFEFYTEPVEEQPTRVGRPKHSVLEDKPKPRGIAARPRSRS